ncbi:CZB domain-containing protein [Campylobacter sp. US33a]
MAFKLNAYKQIFVRSGEKLADHTSCRLGKWMASAGRERFEHNHYFGKITEPHQRVHYNMNNAIETAHNEDITCSQIQGEIIEKCNEAEKASLDLFEVFKDMLLEEKNKNNIQEEN